MKKIQALVHMLESANVDDDGTFAVVVDAFCAVAGFSDLDLANSFGMSRPGVTRWRRGVTAPHPVMRPAIVRTLVKLVTDRPDWPGNPCVGCNGAGFNVYGRGTPCPLKSECSVCDGTGSVKARD